MYNKRKKGVNKMISAWHLIWIIPLSIFIGIMLIALCNANKGE